ncbi:NfeD family protein [Carnobacterium sp. TMP28]|uniref:NfeD family protein n=1 Tax=Carnobacterium sp. TMP28 TaxID=3397060 RepID=UPI0039DFA201
MNILLLSAGFVGLVIAGLTIHYLLGGLLAVGSFAGYFFLNGNGEWFPIVIFILGILLLILEVFIPNFGVAGVLGGLLLFGGIYLNYGDAGQSLFDLSIAGIISVVLAIILLKKGYSFGNFKKLILEENMTKVGGYSSNKDYTDYLGKKGISTTTLRPAGKVAFDDTELDVLSSGEQIEPDTSVEVIKVEGSKIVVRRVS